MKRSIENMEENIVLHIFASTIVHWVEIYWFVHITSQCVEKEVCCKSKKMCLEMERAEMNISYFFSKCSWRTGALITFFNGQMLRLTYTDKNIDTNRYIIYLYIDINISIFLIYRYIVAIPKYRCYPYQSILYHYWQHFECNCVHVTRQRDRQMIVREMEVASSILKKPMHHILTEYVIKKKLCSGRYCTCCFLYKNNVHETVSETSDSLLKARHCVFATTNRYPWNLGAWFLIQIEISEWDLKEKKFIKSTKIPTTNFKGETNDDNGLQLYRHNCHIHGAIWSYSGSACVCKLPSQHFLA